MMLTQNRTDDDKATILRAATGSGPRLPMGIESQGLQTGCNHGTRTATRSPLAKVRRPLSNERRTRVHVGMRREPASLLPRTRAEARRSKIRGAQSEGSEESAFLPGLARGEPRCDMGRRAIPTRAGSRVASELAAEGDR